MVTNPTFDAVRNGTINKLNRRPMFFLLYIRFTYNEDFNKTIKAIKTFTFAKMCIYVE